MRINRQIITHAVIFITLLIVQIPVSNVFAQTPTGYKISKVVIDPGHGGKDPGALGTGRYKNTESDIALAVGLKLRDYILKYFDDVEVIMTRDKDEFIGLKERTNIANRAKAQLFISIHCNTSSNKSASGAETYVIGMHKTKANLEVAKRENQVIFLEENYQERYEGFDNSPEAIIALSMMQNKYLEQSLLFAASVQQQFRDRVHIRDRGVKQAGYVVISYTVMPSVLVELGFISNDKEEDFLNSEEGQVYIASAMYRAFKEYKYQMEGVDTSKKPEKSAKEKVVKKMPEERAAKVVVENEAEKAGLAVVESEKKAENDFEKEKKTMEKGKEAEEKILESGKAKVDRARENAGVNAVDQAAIAKKLSGDSAVADDEKGELVFRIQVVSSLKRIATDPANFKGIKDIKEFEKEGIYKYMTGEFDDFDKALDYQRRLRSEIYPDAFIVAFYNGRIISLKKAFEIMRKQS